MTSRGAQALVTVVVPLYNKRPLVRRAVDSVLTQTHRHVELFVVDDGSEDGGLDTLRGIDDPRLHLLEQPNSGPGAARNKGWRSGRGELVAFLDADDYWLEDFLQWSVARLDADAGIAVSTSGYWELHAPAKLRAVDAVRRAAPAGRFRAAASAPRAFRNVLTQMLPVTTVVRRSLLEHYGGFFDRDRCTYGEDNFLWTQILLNHPIYFDHQPRVVIDRTGSSLSVLSTLGSRPIEPILTHADDVRAVCPADLRPVLERVIAERALKRSCTLAAVGRWREARALRQRLGVRLTSNAKWGPAAMILANPGGSYLARAALQALKLVRRD